MMSPQLSKGRAEYKKAFWSARGLFIVAGIFSCFVNLLMLTGPLFMLQVYDRVLASGSQETLIVLFALVAGLFAVMGVLDYLRGRILANAGARFQAMLDGRVFDGVMKRSLSPTERAKPAAAMRDLESIQQFLSGNAPFAFFDAPWVPIYLGAIFLFHPLLGAFALGAAVLLCFIAILNQILTKDAEIESRVATAEGEKFADSMRRDAETIRALGMGQSAKGCLGRDTWKSTQRPNAALYPRWLFPDLRENVSDVSAIGNPSRWGVACREAGNFSRDDDRCINSHGSCACAGRSGNRELARLCSSTTRRACAARVLCNDADLRSQNFAT